MLSCPHCLRPPISMLRPVDFSTLFNVTINEFMHSLAVFLELLLRCEHPERSKCKMISDCTLRSVKSSIKVLHSLLSPPTLQGPTRLAETQLVAISIVSLKNSVWRSIAVPPCGMQRNKFSTCLPKKSGFSSWYFAKTGLRRSRWCFQTGPSAVNIDAPSRGPKGYLPSCTKSEFLEL